MAAESPKPFCNSCLNDAESYDQNLAEGASSGPGGAEADAEESPADGLSTNNRPPEPASFVDLTAGVDAEVERLLTECANRE